MTEIAPVAPIGRNQDGRWRLRPGRGAWLLAILIAAFIAVSRSTGAGWLMVLVAICIALLAVGLAGPALRIRKIEVSLRSPGDAVVGRSSSFEAVVIHPRGGCVLELTEFASEVAVFAPGNGPVSVEPERRGVHDACTVQIRTAAPLGLAWASRTLTVPLDRPLYVAPAVTPMRLPDRLLADGSSGDELPRQGQGDLVATIRDYQVGDPLKLIHWPASARHDDLLVKDLESPVRPRLLIVASLEGSWQRQEAAASEAQGLVHAGVAAGLPVSLCTLEKSGAITVDIGSAVDSGRRLARAIAGHVAVPSIANGTRVVVVGGS